MIDWEEDPDPRERKSVSELPNRSRRGPTIWPAMRTMFEDLSAPSWNEELLWRCQRGCLSDLCRLLGAPISGTVDQVVTRLMAVRSVHLKLSPFGLGQHEAVASRFNREEIRWMCREARLPRSLNKKTMAWLLLAWRDATKQAGEEYLRRHTNSTAPGWVTPRQRVAPLIHRLYAIIDRRRMAKVS